MNEQYLTEANETLQRVRRIETRLTRLCIHQGVDPSPERTRITLLNADPPVVTVAGLDISFADILTFCKISNIVKITTVMYRGLVLGSVVPPTEAANEQAA